MQHLGSLKQQIFFFVHKDPCSWLREPQRNHSAYTHSSLFYCNYSEVGKKPLNHSHLQERPQFNHLLFYNAKPVNCCHLQVVWFAAYFLCLCCCLVKWAS